MGSILNKTMEVSPSVKLFVDDMIKSKKVVVFSKSYCPYCNRAKKVISKYSVDPQQYESMEIENRTDCGEIQTYLKELTGASSVPRVFISGKSIGGCDDIVKLDNSGQLKQLLEN